MRSTQSTTLSLLCRDWRPSDCPDQPCPDPAHLALAYTQHDKLFSKLGRYKTTIERSYYRAIRELQKLQSSRIRSVSQFHESVADPAPEADSPPEEIRSVSQFAPTPAPGADAAIACTALPCDRPAEEDFFAALDQITAPAGLTDHRRPAL